MFTTMRMMLAGALVSLAGFSASATAAPPAMGNPGFRPLVGSPAMTTPLRPIGGDPRTWSPNPLRPIPPIGSNPRTWSPYPLNYYPQPYPYYPVYNPYMMPYWSPYTSYPPTPGYIPGNPNPYVSGAAFQGR